MQNKANDSPPVFSMWRVSQAEKSRSVMNSPAFRHRKLASGDRQTAFDLGHRGGRGGQGDRQRLPRIALVPSVRRQNPLRVFWPICFLALFSIADNKCAQCCNGINNGKFPCFLCYWAQFRGERVLFLNQYRLDDVSESVIILPHWNGHPGLRLTKAANIRLGI